MSTVDVKRTTAGGAVAKEPTRSKGYGSNTAPVTPNMTDHTAGNPGQKLVSAVFDVDDLRDANDE